MIDGLPTSSPPQADPSPPSHLWRFTLLASLFPHIVIGLILMATPARMALPPPAEESVAVRILTPQEFENVTRPADEKTATAPILARPAVAAEPEFKPLQKKDVVAEPDAGMIEARQFYSANVLAKPESRQARAALAELDPGERVIQLCNVEALEQVHRLKPGWHPDLLVAYAMGEVKLAKTVLSAEGGAIRSDAHWYRLAFRCEVGPDLAEVASFAFRLGDEIPREQWADHYLTADRGPADQ